YFNSMADTWDVNNTHDGKKLGLMLDLLYIKKSDSVLDVGTGTGVLLPLLTEKAGTVTAIDASDKMLEKARQKYPDSGVNFINADVMEWPFPADFFDHIICYSVFPHLQNKNAVIRRFSEILKPGGLLSVLHSSSNEKINGVHIHAHSSDINSDYLLPAVKYIPVLNKYRLRNEIIIDTEEIFMFCGRKLWQEK
ncbi:MAG: class I SAM-dependent methyltransferase, partial [Treponema sp.]|nr:class I SAM-dependent methyltransferase [Treponema sp.]